MPAITIGAESKSESKAKSFDLSSKGLLWGYLYCSWKWNCGRVSLILILSQLFPDFSGIKKNIWLSFVDKKSLSHTSTCIFLHIQAISAQHAHYSCTVSRQEERVDCLDRPIIPLTDCRCSSTTRSQTVTVNYWSRHEFWPTSSSWYALHSGRSKDDDVPCMPFPARSSKLNPQSSPHTTASHPAAFSH